MIILTLLFSAGCKKPAGQPDGTADSTAGSTASTEKEEPFIPVLRFVVTSDVHIRKEAEDLQSHQILADFYKTAYDYAGNHPDYKKLDGIFFLSDISNNGYEEEHTQEGTYTRTVMGNHEFMATGNFKNNSTVESADAENPMISFPQAICKDGISNYRIEFYQNDTLVHTIYRLSENYYGDATPNPLKTNLGQLKAGTYTLKVYATSSYALHSDPITVTLTVQ